MRALDTAAAAVVLAVALAAVPLASAVGPPAGGAGPLHGNHVTVDPQVSGDGTVVAETATALTDGFVVVRTDDGGQPGEPVGHTRVNGSRFRTDVPVQVDPETWDGWSGNRTLWAVVHADDGDGTFDMETDRSLATRSPAARVSFTLRKGTDGDVRVLARQFDAHSLAAGRLTVRRVDLDGPGYLVARTLDGDRVLGTTALETGRHSNVSVALDPSYRDGRESPFRVRLLAYRDDGDGTFDDGDRPVRAGDSAVGTDVVVAPPNESGTATDAPLVVTPSPTDPPTAAPTPADGSSPTTDPTAPRTETTATGPGFGTAVTALAVAVLVLAARRRPSE